LITSSWGILAPEPVASERRTRTLGLGAAVRMFNDLAVPGMGGVWFGKQLFLATLGVAVCEEARRHNVRFDNIKVANALEALACWMQHQANDGLRDDRLRGIQKLGSVDGKPVFSQFAQPGFYVSQPMRMATVQAIKALGLVDSLGERFNSYSCTAAGLAFIRAVIAKNRPHRRDAIEVLGAWVCGANINVDTAAMHAILSPTLPLPLDAADSLRELIVRGDGSGAARRRAALDWIGSLVGKSRETGQGQPLSLSAEHWHDVQAGALFFSLQADAYRVLDAVEVVLTACQGQPLGLELALVPKVCAAVEVLRASANRYLKHGFLDPDGTGANAFAQACVSASDGKIVEELVGRDERVLRLRDGMIVPGQAFDPARELAGAAPDDPNAPAAPEAFGSFPLPEGVSYRLRNLYLLNLDLTGQLNSWLDKTDPPPRTPNGQT
jgi:hypothetical protein